MILVSACLAGEKCRMDGKNKLVPEIRQLVENGEALRICRENACTMAILKSKSPSCGCGVIHNGQFNGGLTEGNGVLAQMLLDAGIPVVTERNSERSAKRMGDIKSGQ